MTETPLTAIEAEVTPAANVSVPEVAVKSPGDVAVPAAVV